jgi:hypothetical protein
VFALGRRARGLADQQLEPETLERRHVGIKTARVHFGCFACKILSKFLKSQTRELVYEAVLQSLCSGRLPDSRHQPDWIGAASKSGGKSADRIFGIMQ